MMRSVGVAWAVSLAILASVPVSGGVSAGATNSGIDVEVTAAGGDYDDSKTYIDPCAGVVTASDPDSDDGSTVPVGPLRFVSQRISNVQNFDALDGQTRLTNGYLEVRWWTRCLEADGSEVSSVTERFWVGVPRDIDLVNDAFDAAMELVPAPNVSWPTKDPEFGWVYVNTSTEWRVDNLAAVSATAEAENRIASAEATVTASPQWVTLLPGEPGAGIGRCNPEQAAAPFYIDIISACSYTYKNSSAISPTSAFEATIEVTWNVETDVADVDPFDDLVTSWSEQLQVGEVQALVIAGP